VDVELLDVLFCFQYVSSNTCIRRSDQVQTSASSSHQLPPRSLWLVGSNAWEIVLIHHAIMSQALHKQLQGMLAASARQPQQQLRQLNEPLQQSAVPAFHEQLLAVLGLSDGSWTLAPASLEKLKQWWAELAPMYSNNAALQHGHPGSASLGHSSSSSSSSTNTSSRSSSSRQEQSATISTVTSSQQRQQQQQQPSLYQLGTRMLPTVPLAWDA